MEIKLQIKDGSVFSFLTEDQVDEITNNLTACIPNGGRVVIFCDTAPLDTCNPWQKIDCCGTPIGKIKYYKEGVWQ